MTSTDAPRTSRRIKQASLGLLVAATAAGVAAPELAQAETAHHEGPAAGTRSQMPTNVHEATEQALHAVARQAVQGRQSTPVELVSATTKAAPAAAAAHRTYAVRSGDTLSGIAHSQLGDGTRYGEIFQLNEGKSQHAGGSLTDPNVLQVGWVLQLPSGTKAKPADILVDEGPDPIGQQNYRTPSHRQAAPTAALVSHVTTVTGTGHGSARRIAQSIVPAGELGCFSEIISHESGWNVNAVNPTSGAYGLAQALPGAKMASAGADWRNDAATQVRWALKYMDQRYGSPCEAWSFWQGHSWY